MKVTPLEVKVPTVSDKLALTAGEKAAIDVSNIEDNSFNIIKYKSLDKTIADVDEDGNFYVADRGNHCIRVITPDGEVSTYAGQNKAGMVDGIASLAEFNNPEGCQFGPDGALYVADYSNHAIRKVEDGPAQP